MTDVDRSSFPDGTEMGRRIAAHDWASTPIGPVESWPGTLRAAVRLLLRSRYPMLVTWGEQYTQIYNDAYAQLIGERHPAALGIDIRVTLAESWGVLEPLVDEAMVTGVATWIPALQLLLERSGYREESYFSVSHAPAEDDDGRVQGMFCVCSEVTDQVVGERRLRLLRELSTRAGDARTEEEAVARVLEALAEHPLDVPFAALYLRDADGLHHVGGLGGVPAEGWAAVDAAARGDVAVDPVEGHPELTGGPWDDPVREAVGLPLRAGADEAPFGVLLAGVSPSRALDEAHRSFFDVLSSQVAVAVGNARAHQRERRRVEALAALDRAKSDFFANVSHEFRTPLTLLLGPLQDALEDGDEVLPPGQRDRVDLAARNARRMLKLVNGLLDVSRLEGGAAPLNRRPLDLARFTAELASVFRSAVERAGLALEVDCPPLSRPASVDPDLWEQVVLNLVSNAFKYTFTGRIAVAVREQGDQVALRVADTGVGIPPEELPHLFERFHRVKDSQARTHEGTGVGLALVKSVAEQHGGVARATSRVGEGSVFEVVIPAGDPAASAPAVPVPSARAGLAEEEALGWMPHEAPAAGDGGAAPEGARRVLVADDNADMRRYVERILRLHFEVGTVADGQAALDAVRAEAPDLVLTDVMMPRLDGFELLAALRRDPATASIPVVVLTARSGPEAAVEGLRRGADDYLVKPFAAEELLVRVQANLSRGARAGRPSGLDGGGADRLARRRRREGAGPSRGGAVPAEAPIAEPEASEADGVLRLRVPAHGRHLAWMRSQLRDHLVGLGVDRTEVDLLLLGVSEAATNAVEHAQDPSPPVVELRAALEDGRASVEVRDHGRWKPRGPSLDRGRGSMVMESIADVRTVPGDHGTRVTLTSRGPGEPGP